MNYFWIRETFDDIRGDDAMTDHASLRKTEWVDFWGCGSFATLGLRLCTYAVPACVHIVRPDAKREHESRVISNTMKTILAIRQYACLLHPSITNTLVPSFRCLEHFSKTPP